MLACSLTRQLLISRLEHAEATLREAKSKYTTDDAASNLATIQIVDSEPGSSEQRLTTPKTELSDDNGTVVIDQKPGASTGDCHMESRGEKQDQELCLCIEMERHMLPELTLQLGQVPDLVQDRLPADWKWDVQHHSSRHSWTCTPEEESEPVHFPLTIAGAPLVLPVEHQWPPIGGVNPPPDPRLSAPIDCKAQLSTDVIRDIFLTFQGCIGFYVLINGLLQIIVSSEFDTMWASSHLPHKFGGLKVSYIEQSLDPTMLPSETATTRTDASLSSQDTDLASLLRLPQHSAKPSASSLHINDFIEARGRSTHREKYTGRIGLSVAKDNVQYLIMSSHVITEAMLARSFFGRGRSHTERLRDDWNQHVDIWAGNEKVESKHSSMLPTILI